MARRHGWPLPALSAAQADDALRASAGHSQLSGRPLSTKGEGGEVCASLVPRDTARALAWPDNCVVVTPGEARCWARVWAPCLSGNRVPPESEPHSSDSSGDDDDEDEDDDDESSTGGERASDCSSDDDIVSGPEPMHTADV